MGHFVDHMPSYFHVLLRVTGPLCFPLYTAVKHALGVFWPDGEQGLLAPDMFLPEKVELSLITLLGVMVWLSRESFWKFRWVVKQGATTTLDLLLPIWIKVLALWLSTSGQETLVSDVQHFRLVLRQLSETGVLPRKVPQGLPSMLVSLRQESLDREVVIVCSKHRK